MDDLSRWGAGRDRAALAACALLLAGGCGTNAGPKVEPQDIQPILSPAPGSPIAVPFAPGGVALGDLDNDRTLDLIVRSAESPAITVLLGTGDGRFGVAPSSPIQLREYSSEIGLGDIDGDGWLDLVLGNHESYSVELLLGDGTGNFHPLTSVSMKDGQDPHTHGLALGDLDNDGDVDIVTGNTADGDVAVALGDGRGGFTVADDSPFPVNRGPYPLALGHLNDDGCLDVAVTSTLNQTGQSGDALTVLLCDGQGGFERRQAPMRTPDPWFVAIGDINADGKPDLVSSHWERRELTVLVGNGEGGFSEVPKSPFDLGHSAWYVGVADVNGDGNDDVAAAADDGVRLMLGDGQGGFDPAAGSPYPTGGGSWRLAMGDLNGDGKSDVVTSNLAGANVTVLLAR